ncbi:MAG: cyclopropane-fatty-acyl-phospholipid synthase [Rhodobacterales bacterium CG2_30_65_12]|nr:MAG: cyclopropane-fatty-acyl-phospholipid synthase [Rhodobacterales bacterium CG2_30_65_12]
MSFITTRIQRDLFTSCERMAQGSLTIRTPEGEVHRFGNGAPEAELQINDWAAITATAARGDIGFGEAYVAGLWDTPSIQALTELVLLNYGEFEGYANAGFWPTLKFRLVDRLLRANSKRGAARNIRAHYDVGNEFYQTWLDPSMTYSSALFTEDDTDLLRAQQRKYDRILGRLGEGERILEIGCGWGGFAERAAQSGRHVTGLTISPNQKGYADARLDGRAEIRLQDYRDTTGKFDNIVSIEMIEAVGERYWPTYFGAVKDRLAEGGRAVIQAITVADDYFPIYRKNSDYIRQYTFPGGMLLSNAVIRERAENAGLQVRETFAFGKDYARTCTTWAQQLESARPRLARLGYEGPFLRNWRFYLEICAAAFAVGQTDVVQVELSHA